MNCDNEIQLLRRYNNGQSSGVCGLMIYCLCSQKQNGCSEYNDIISDIIQYSKILYVCTCGKYVRMFLIVLKVQFVYTLELCIQQAVGRKIKSVSGGTGQVK